jgi:glycosyltransferase involved in cell wall biosynthesis
VCGLATRCRNVVQHTFSRENHVVLTFDGLSNQIEQFEYEGITIHRFPDLPMDEFMRFKLLDHNTSNTLRLFQQFVRAMKPTCIAAYHGNIFTLIKSGIPEARIVFMPIVFPGKDYKVKGLDFRNLKLVVFDNFTRDRYIETGFPAANIHSTQKPIDIDFFCPLPLLRDRYRLLYVGRIASEKRIPDFLKAAHRVFWDYPQLRFHIAGPDKDPLKKNCSEYEIQRIRDTAQSLNLLNQILFRGQCLGVRLLEEYSCASIHVMPSYYEAFNTSTQESLAMGMRCVNIRTNEYDWPEWTPNGVRLIHYIDHMEDFDPVLRQLLKMNESATTRDFIEQNWSWNHLKKEYESFFMDW